MSYNEVMMSWLAAEEQRLAISPDKLLNDPLFRELEDRAKKNEALFVALQHWSAILAKAKHERQPVLATLSTYTSPPQAGHLDYDPIQFAVLLAQISYIVHGLWTMSRKGDKAEDLSSLDKTIDVLEVTIDVVKSVLQAQGVEVPSEIEIIALALYLLQLQRAWGHSPPTSLPEPSAAPPEVTDAPSAELSSDSESEPSADPSKEPDSTKRSS